MNLFEFFEDNECAVTETVTGGATSVTANGYVVARTRASVSSKVAGRLAFLGVSEGSFVRAGALIGRLENADYGAQVSLAEANVASARARVAAVHAEQKGVRLAAGRYGHGRRSGGRVRKACEWESSYVVGRSDARDCRSRGD